MAINTTLRNNTEERELAPIKPWVCPLLCMVLLAILNFARSSSELSHEYKQHQKPVELKQLALSPSIGNGAHQVDRSWCPEATCLVSPVCDPCRRRFLIIITNGRSASTTLTWMLGSLPGVRMGGENNNALLNIKTLIDKTTAPPFKLRPTANAKYSAWNHNPIPNGSLACMAQNIIETIVPPVLMNSSHLYPKEQDEIVGFKTVRLVRDIKATELPVVANFLKEWFPCARFIINYRSEVVKQALSQKKAFVSQSKDGIDVLVKRISSEVERLKALADLLGNQSMTLDSSRWTKDVEELNKAVQWLGFGKRCSFSKLMKLNTGLAKQPAVQGKYKFNQIKKSSSAAYQHSDTMMDLDPHCQYMGR